MSYNYYVNQIDPNIDWKVLPVCIDGKEVVRSSFYTEYSFLINEKGKINYYVISDGHNVYKNALSLIKDRDKMDSKEADELLKNYKWYTKEDLQKIEPTVSTGKEILYCLDRLTNGRIYFDNPLKSHYMVDKFSTDMFDININRGTLSVLYKGSLIAEYKRNLFKINHKWEGMWPQTYRANSDYQESIWTLTKIVDMKLKRMIEENVADFFTKEFHIKQDTIVEYRQVVYIPTVAFRDKRDYINTRNTLSKLEFPYYIESPAIIKASNVPKVIGRRFNVSEKWYKPSVEKALKKYSLTKSLSIQDYRDIVESVTDKVYNRFNNAHYYENKYLRNSIKRYTQECTLDIIRSILYSKEV